MSSVRAACTADAASIASIYNPYIANTTITFEEQAVTGTDITARLEETAAAGLPWLVADDDRDNLAGYAYASTWKSRCAYRYSAEVTVYLAAGADGQGLGTTLYTALIDELRRIDYHCALGGIALPNAASVALHEKLGFEKVAHFHEVGFKFGRWIDVGYWQLLI